MMSENIGNLNEDVGRLYKYITFKDIQYDFPYYVRDESLLNELLNNNFNIRIFINKDPLIGATLYFKENLIYCYEFVVFNNLRVKNKFYEALNSDNTEYIPFLKEHDMKKMSFFDYEIKKDEKEGFYYLMNKKNKLILKSIYDIISIIKINTDLKKR
jgi:hypothetical protein